MKKKSELLISYLYNRTSWTSRNELANFLNVSTRQVTNYVNDINKNGDIILSSLKGYKINPSYIGKNIQLEDAYSIEKRNTKIAKMLCYQKRGIDYYDMADNLYISTSLLESTINSLRPLFENFSLNLYRKNEKYFLEGDEHNIRRFITIQIYKNNLNTYEVNCKIKNCVSLSHIKKILKLNDIFINDYSLSLLVLNLNVMLERIQSGYTIRSRKKTENEISQQYDDALRDIVYYIKQLINISITNAEKNYIKELLISLSTLYDPLKINNKNVEKYVEKKYIEITDRVIENVRTAFPTVSFDDNFRVRFAIHVRNCFLQKNFESYNIDNLTKRIKYSYPLIYDASVYIADFLEQNYDLSMTQNEITYIAFHICSSLNDFTDYKVTITYIYSDYWSYHKKVLDSLIGSISDKAIIKESVSVSDYVPSIYHSDMIVTDSEAIFSEPCIHISSLPSKDNIKAVSRLVDKLYQKKQYTYFCNNFLQFFSKECFMFYGGNDSTQLIKNICSEAKKLDLIDDLFMSDVLKRERLANTAFNTVAIPHTLSVNSIKTFIFVVILKQPLSWGQSDTEVKLVILLGINQKDRKTFTHIYDFMVNILSNANSINILSKSKDYNDFISKLNTLAKECE